jgi:hypothetical protein
MSAITAGRPLDRGALDQLVAELRPKLHRYCARMAGSVVDGEDVVQEAIVKAIEALPQTGLSRTRRLGCSASLTIRRSIFCDIVPDWTPHMRTKTQTRLSIQWRSWTIGKAQPLACGPSCVFL